jgi:pimeloyl-ACP methyl ester carboxylesterase
MLAACAGDVVVAANSTVTSERSASSTTPTTAPLDGLVDVGGRGLDVDCRGEGSPTVVFEAGLGNDRHEFAIVQRGVAKATRACTYSRAGLGRSDPPPQGARDGRAMVDDLRRLVEAVPIDGPIVLVGASWGGMLVRVYAAEHPTDIVGVVLVDGSHPGQLVAFQAALSATMPADEVAGLSEAYLQAFEDNSEGVTRTDLAATEALVAATDIGDIPLVVLAHGRVEAEFTLPGVEAAWQALQAELAALSPSGRLEVVADAGHVIAAAVLSLLD